MYYNIFTVFAELACGQPSQEAPKYIHDQTIHNWWIIFMFFLEYWLKSAVFRQLVNSMQNQVQSNQPGDTWQSTGWCDQPVGHPWSISVFKLHFLLVGILNILPQVLCSQPLLKDSLSF